MDRMTVTVEWKATGSDDGTLEGYASTFGNIDLGADVVVKGAFTDTIGNIKAHGIPLLADHVASTSSVLGTIFDRFTVLPNALAINSRSAALTIRCSLGESR